MSPRCARASRRPASSRPSRRQTDALIYDDSLLAAVRAFQTAQGIDADGSVGAGTLAALNRPVGDRIVQIEVNLERGRWLLHDLDPTFVVVNVAGFRVYYLRDGALAWSARVQVGKPFRQTPIFRSTIQYLVLNPTWTVPPGIFANDILPAVKRDPGYLAKRELRVVDGKGEPVTAPIDWAAVTPRSFPYMLQQGPGPDNALGRVKFMFPNEYSVYLHDTPSQALFEKSERAFSSGCIRVENALELAALLLDGQADWNAAAIASAVEAGTTRTVTLAAQGSGPAHVLDRLGGPRRGAELPQRRLRARREGARGARAALPRPPHPRAVGPTRRAESAAQARAGNPVAVPIETGDSALVR